MTKIGIGLGIVYARNYASGGTAPSSTVAPVASAPYYISGQTISVTNGTWSGDTPITYAYQWQSSADGVSGWSNVGTNSSTYAIPSSAAQLLFYRCQVTATNAFGSATANSAVVGGVDSEANTHFNRVTADSGVMTYGLIGVDTTVKSLKFIYGSNAISSGILNDFIWYDYLGYKAGSGSGTTAGRAIQKAYSLAGANYDRIQNSTTAQPFLAAFDGTNKYLLMQGLNDVGFSTPNNINNQLTGDFGIELRANIGATGGYCGKTNGSPDTNFILNRNGGTLSLRIAQSGTQYTYSATATTTAQYIRVSRNSTTGIIKFFSSTDGTTWTQVGTDISGITGTLTNPNAPVWIGFARAVGGATGEFYYVNFYKDDSFTTATQKFEPNSYNRATSQTSFTSSTGEVWTITLPITATGLKPMIVDQTMIQGNGTTMGMQAASASMNTKVFTQYNVWRKFSNAITTVGILNEVGSSVSSGQGIAFAPNEAANTESVYTSSNGGLNGTSWQSNSLLLKVSTYQGDVDGSPYEQGLLTNNVANTFNAVQSAGVNTDPINATGYNLLARNNAASLWSNYIHVAQFQTNQTDTTAQRLAMYNLLSDLTNIV